MRNIQRQMRGGHARGGYARGGKLRGDRGFGRKLGLWCAGVLAILMLLAMNLWLRSTPAQAHAVSLNALKGAYARVVPGHTPAPDLARLGFDPARGGVRRLTHLALMERFAPHDSSDFDRLAPSAQKCLNAPEGCSAYVFHLARALGQETGATFGFVNAAEAADPRGVVEVVFLVQDGRVAWKQMSGV